MPSPRSLSLTLGALGASVLVLAGCASTTSAADAGDDRLSVVATTNVYGQIAEQIGGDRVAVTSIISSDSQDPHSFEPSARDQLAVSKADLIVENGGGYDAFVDALIESSGTEAPILTAVEFSSEWPGESAHDDGDARADDEDHADEGEHADDHDHDHEHVEGFNEHVWYDPQAMADLALAIAAELGELSPADADAFDQAADALVGEIAGLDAELSGIRDAHADAAVFVTEPVPVYLVTAAGLIDVTPNAFSEAVEEGQDVAPATLLEALDLVGSGDVRVVITNAQTGGAETVRIVDEAEESGVPVIGFSETLPAGQTYISWMRANIEALTTALGA